MARTHQADPGKARFRLIAWAALALASTACGENPHILGQDPKSSVDERHGEPGTADTDPRYGQTGKEKGEDGECVYLSHFAKSSARPEEGGFATPLSVPLRETVQSVRGAWLTLHPEGGSQVATAATTVCLLDPAACVSFKPGEAIRIDVLALIGQKSIFEVLYSKDALHWSVSAGLAETRLCRDQLCKVSAAELKIEFLGNACYRPLTPAEKAVAKKPGTDLVEVGE